MILGVYGACCKLPSSLPGRLAQASLRVMPPLAAGEPPAPLFTNLFEYLEVNVVDPGYVVDQGVYGAPDQPHNPDRPRCSRRWGGRARSWGSRGDHEAGGVWEGPGLPQPARQEGAKDSVTGPIVPRIYLEVRNHPIN